MSVRLATGPVCWGVDTAAHPANPPWPEVLDGIVAAGFESIELGPVGYLPTDTGDLRAELARRGLRAVAGFVFEPLADAALRPATVAVARRAARATAAAGGRHLLIIDRVAAPRERTAGRPLAAAPLDGSRRRALADGIRAVAEEATGHGLQPLVHPHAGTWIESRAEIEWAAGLADLCLDTGHCAYSGLDPVEVFDALGDRIAQLHLKDVDPDVLSAVRRRHDGFWAAVRHRVFCPVGRGMVDFASLARALAARRFDGCATVEQDRVAGEPGDPVADLVAARRHLEHVGIGERPAAEARA